MPRGPEAKIQDAVVAHARATGYIAYKFESPNKPGVPDFLFSHPACGPFWVEFKAPGGKPRPLQVVRQAEMAKAGCLVFNVASARAGTELLDEMVAGLGTTLEAVK